MYIDTNIKVYLCIHTSIYLPLLKFWPPKTVSPGSATAGPFAKVRAPQADKDSSILLEIFTKTFSLPKVLIEIYYTFIPHY